MSEQTFEVDQTGTPNESKATAGRGRTGVEEGVNLLDRFKQDMAEDLAVEDARFPHRYRTGYEMSFGTLLAQPTLDTWKRRCKIPNAPPGENINLMKLLGIVLANMNTGIYLNGEQIIDSSGEPLTFRSPDFLATFGAADAEQAIRAFMGKDGFFQALGEAVVVACGFGDDVAPDPTGG